MIESEYSDMVENEGNIFYNNLKCFDYYLELNWKCLETIFFGKSKEDNPVSLNEKTDVTKEQQNTPSLPSSFILSNEHNWTLPL